MAKVTEADAALRWCPFTRTYAFSVPTTVAGREVVGPAATGGPANRYINGATVENNPENCRCLGSQCMAWVWVGPEPGDPTLRIGCCGLAHDRT